MKNFSKAIIWLIILASTYSTYANVDQTNPFSFSYDCSASGWVLNADFNLWWHHHYLRSYKIDKPWVIQISDSTHTTISKFTWISIDWCNYTPDTCNISNWSNWSLISTWTTLEINITTNLPIIKSWNTLTINWEWSNETISIMWFQNAYVSHWKKVYLNFNDTSIVLSENSNNWNWNNNIQEIEKIDFVNNVYNTTKEYYYTFSSNNKNIKLQKNIFKKVWTWTAKSSTNLYDTFSAYTWQNTWDSSVLLADRMWKEWYSTWLDLWDFNQHNYTTTKINVYPIDLSCSETQTSNWESNVDYSSFTWTLGWIVEPIFWGDNMKINWFSKDSFWGFSILATWALDINWLEYIKVWKIDSKLLWVSKINISIKENDYTKAIITKTIFPAKDTKWNFNVYTNNLDLNWQSKIKWNYQIVFSFYSWNQQIWSYEVPLYIFPSNISESKSSVTLLTTVNSKLANNSDYYEYKLTLKDDFWNLINWTLIDSINQECLSDIWCKTITTNMINNLWTEWSDALIEYDYQWINTDSNWKLNFKVKSLSPWVFTSKFKITVDFWDLYPSSPKIKSVSLSDIINWTNSFKKLFIANLSVSDDDWVTWWWVISFWTSLKYMLRVDSISSTIINYVIDNIESSIKATDEANYSAVNISVDPETLNSDPIFNATINTSETATSIKNDIWIKLSPKPVIKYTIWWQQVSYRLSRTETDYNSLLPISVENANDFLWVQIVWTLQWQWKQKITWQQANFSDLSKQDIRTNIRKNAYSYIWSMTNNQVLNWVKYVEWDITISWSQSYETLVVKNWNVIINWDLNPANSTLWIIVLKDSYDVNTWVNWKWNVFVTPNVTKINAIIYADWWLISANSNWVPYTSDNSTRTYELKNQLVMNWSLFTRNTIWWSILVWWSYKLPWDKVSSDFNKAMIYDLNYTRRWKWLCEKISSTICKYDDWAFVIIYNPIIQTKPPKLFTK